ncbi:MAG: hypothetical protein WBM13_03550 [Bacteroidia bacterium]
MKKGLLFVAVIAASLASCKKDHTCTCTTTTNGVADPTPQVFVVNDARKSDVKKVCVNSTSTYTYNNGMTTVTNTDVRTCELK